MSSFAYSCIACPAGKRSLGGFSPCIDCAGAQCVQGSEWATLHDAAIPADLAEQLVHGDTFSMTVSSYKALHDSLPSVAVSSRFRVDLTPPRSGQVLDVVPCALDALNCTGSTRPTLNISRPSDVVAARWIGFADGESGIMAYEYCVGTSELVCDVAEMMRVDNSTSWMQLVLSDLVAHGSKTCVSVRAVNGVGLQSELISSHCVLYDSTPPQMEKVSASLDVNTHNEEQSDVKIVFGSVLAYDDIDFVDIIEWCIGSDNSSTWDQEGDHDGSNAYATGGNLTVQNLNFTTWALSVCDITPIDVAQCVNNSKAGAQTKFAFGVVPEQMSSIMAEDIDILYIGARVRSQTGMYSKWMWSSSTKVGALKASVDTSKNSSDVTTEINVPGYQGSGRRGQNAARRRLSEVAGDTTHATISVSGKTSAVRYEKLNQATSRRLSRLGAVRNLSISSSAWEVTRSSLRKSFSRGTSSLQHESTVSFALELTGDSDEVFEYSNIFKTEELLLPDDPVLSDPLLMARLQPTLWAFDTSKTTWVTAASTCSNSTPWLTEPGCMNIRRAHVHKSTGPCI